MTKCEILKTALTVVLACVVPFSAALSAESAASGKPVGFEALNLSSTSIADATVHYEKSFEAKLPVFEREYGKFLAEKQKGKEIISKRNLIIADINHILGTNEPDTKVQNRIWTGFFGLFSMEETTFYLVKQNTIKNFLRAGGQLPNSTYEKASDTVLYRPEFKTTSEDGPIKDFEFTFPIASDATFEKNVSSIFRVLQDALGSSILSATIHEVVEATLLIRAKPTDPYWRWFSDGFANAITHELLKKHVDEKSAAEFAACHDPNNYKKLEKEINLRYWMSLQYCVLQRTPVDEENELALARYAYATLEAQRLTKTYGIDCAHKILDEVCAQESRTGQDLLRAVKEVTGENMQQRLARYQSFETRKEGIAKYAALFNEASEKKDYRQMFVNLLRTMELRPRPFSPTSLRDFKQAALFLFRLGYEEAGDEVMQNCIRLFEDGPIPAGRQAAMEMFIIYALDCKKAKKASKIAEELLKTKPNHVLSLTVQMLVHAEAGRLNHAKRTARKIQSLTTDEKSSSYRIASRILAIEPNQPGPPK